MEVSDEISFHFVPHQCEPFWNNSKKDFQSHLIKISWKSIWLNSRYLIQTIIARNEIQSWTLNREENSLVNLTKFSLTNISFWRVYKKCIVLSFVTSCSFIDWSVVYTYYRDSFSGRCLKPSACAKLTFPDLLLPNAFLRCTHDLACVSTCTCYTWNAWDSTNCLNRWS